MRLNATNMSCAKPMAVTGAEAKAMYEADKTHRGVPESFQRQAEAKRDDR